MTRPARNGIWGSPAGRVVVVAVSVVAITFAGLLVALWLWGREPRPVPLDADWAAVVTVLAGDGVAAVRDGDAGRARFSDPFGIAAAADGTVYVADAGDAQRIRRVAP